MQFDDELLHAFHSNNWNVEAACGANKELCDKLSGFDRVTAMEKVASMYLCPDLVRHKYRLELLLHAIGLHCQGGKNASLNDCANWFDELGQSTTSHYEDESEDVFVQLIQSNEKHYRALDGVLESSPYCAEHIVRVIDNMPDQSPYTELRTSVHALLAISEEMCERAGLKRYTVGTNAYCESFSKDLSRRVEGLQQCVRFTTLDIEKLGYQYTDLEHFVCQFPEMDSLGSQELFNSALVRKPLIRDNTDLLVVHPAALSVALRQFVIEWAQSNGFIEKLVDALALSVTENFEDAPFLGKGHGIPIQFQRQVRISAGCKTVDEGRYVGVIFVMDTMEGYSETGLGGYFQPPKNKIVQIQYAIHQIAAGAAKEQGVRHGVIFVVGCGSGRGWALTDDLKVPQPWYLVHISEADFFTLCWTKGISPLKIFTLLDSESKLSDLGAHLHNMSGFLNLVAWARSQKGHLIPHGQIPEDISKEAPLMIDIDPASVRTLRAETYDYIDPHVAIDIDAYPYRVIKHTSSIFPEDRARCVHVTHQIPNPVDWKTVFEGRNDWWAKFSVAAESEAYQKWQIISVWLPRIAIAVERKFQTLNFGQLELVFDFQGTTLGWLEERGAVSADAVADAISCKFSDSRNQIKVSIGQSFDDACSLPENIAEKTLVEKVVAAIVERFSLGDPQSELEALIPSIVPNAHARQTHAFCAREYRDYVRAADNYHVVRLTEEDNAYLRIGASAELMPIGKTHEFRTKEDCQKWLNTKVKAVGAELAKDVAQFNRTSLLRTLMVNYEAAAFDRSTWTRTAAAVEALHDDKKTTAQLLNEQFGKINGIHQSCRCLIEVANIYANDSSQKIPGELDLIRLMTKATDIIAYGGWSDAIRWDAVEPYLRITPLGDLQINHEFQDTIAARFFHRATTGQYTEAKEGYHKNFETAEIVPSVASSIDKKFHQAWEEEMGFSIDSLRVFCDCVDDFGMKTRDAVIQIESADLISLQIDSDVQPDQLIFQKIVDELTMPTMSSWDDIPQGYDEKDLMLWRFRRRLSPLRKPLVLLDCKPATFIVAPGMLREACNYLIRGYLDGNFDTDQCRSKKMRSWLGKIADEQGKAFENDVAQKLTKLGWATKAGKYLSEITGNGAHRDLGDIDIIASNNEGRVLIIECKDVRYKKTLGEIAEQISKFRGEHTADGKKDLLRKHLDRFEEIANHKSLLTKFLGLSDGITLESHIIFKNPVPMQYAWDKLSEKAHISVFDDIESI